LSRIFYADSNKRVCNNSASGIIIIDSHRHEDAWFVSKEGPMIQVPIIDREKCTLCKRCVSVCPQQILLVDGDAVKTAENECMLCSHCYTVCRLGAIRFDPEALTAIAMKSFTYKEKLFRPGAFKASDLVNLVRSRRSVRKFRDDPVDDSVLADLIEFAVTAPSGSNCQTWEFLAINGREKVWNLALEIRKFFVKLNRLAKNPLVRYLSVPFIGTALVRYYNEHIESVEMGLKEAEEGKDILFHGAPALIIVHGKMEGSTPLEDAQYASYNITLLAHALGLGTCYIGYAVESLNRSSSIKNYLGIPSAHKIFAVLAAGFPDVKFEKLALRKKYSSRIV
jgi:nitroreductase/NAD-dependent dihydropyrimidine dehydrogenase PreA subunit